MLEQLNYRISKTEFKPPNAPPHKFPCGCEMCVQLENKEIQKRLNQRAQLINKKLEDRIKHGNFQLGTGQEYFWIIRRLIVPHNKICVKGPEIFIPEICFYREGEPYSVIMNKQLTDPTIKEIVKERLPPSSMFNKFLQKTLNERRRKYRQKILTHSKPSEQRRSNQMSTTVYLKDSKDKQQKVDTKNAVVIRYNDGYEELITESEFLQLMGKRSRDTVWHKISFIRNYIQIKDEEKDSMRIKFDLSQLQNPQHLERSRRLMRVYGTNIMKDEKQYISDQEEIIYLQSLKEEGMDHYFFYLTCRVMAFVQFFHDSRIQKGVFQWAHDELGHPVLLSLYKLQVEELVKFDWTNEVVERRMQEAENKVFYSKDLPILNQHELGASRRIQDVMDQQYQDLKTFYGLSLKVKEDTELAENNAFFRKLHPECKVDISDALTPNMTVQNFRKIFLGEKKEKRPLVTDFKSGMLSILHNMSPPKKRNPIQLKMYDPRQTLSASRTKPGTANTKERPGRNLSTRQTSTRTSFKQTINRLDELNRSLYCYDL